jgi:hypothetical protein
MQPNVSSITDHYFRQASSNFIDNLSSTIAALATTVPVNSTAPYTNGDYVVCTIEPGTANQATFAGQVSGNTFINCVWTEGNLAIGHNSGKTVVDYDSATHYALLVKGITAEHDSDGTHGSITPTAISVNGQTWATLATGWMDAGETWTYDSGFLSVPTGGLIKYPVGTKIGLVQSSTAKYFYVTKAVTFGGAVRLTLAAGSDYTLANATITSPRYSYADSPQGFPEVFNSTSTLLSWATNTHTVSFNRFSISGRHVFFWFRATLTSTAPSGNLTVTLPVTAATTNNYPNSIWAQILYRDTSATTNYVGPLIESSTSGSGTATYIESTNNTTTTVTPTAPFTWATTDIVDIRGDYWISELV